MPRVLLRLAFDGARFHGSQRQPDLPTVDGAILQALEAADLLAEDPRLRAAGRTDRGVSALDHPVAIDVTDEPDRVCQVVAGRNQGILPWAACTVPEGYDPRPRATARTYRYHWPLGDDLDVEAAGRAWQRFEGTHTFEEFARVRDGKDPRREVHRCESWQEGGMLILQVTGRSFLWNQVRRMVGACLDVAEGRFPAHAIDEALSGQRTLPNKRTMPPEGLILLRVALDVDPEPTPKAYEVAHERVATDHRRDLQAMATRELVLSLGHGGERKKKR